MKNVLEQAHRDAASVVGELSLTITRRSLRPEAPADWAARLEAAAKMLRSLSVEAKRKKH